MALESFVTLALAVQTDPIEVARRALAEFRGSIEKQAPSHTRNGVLRAIERALDAISDAESGVLR